MDPFIEFFRYLEVAKLSKLKELYDSEISPKIKMLDDNVFSVPFFTSLFEITIHKYPTFSKALKQLPLLILKESLSVCQSQTTTELNNNNSKHLKLVANCILKSIQQTLITPCTRTKDAVFAIPCTTLIYGLDWLDTLLEAFNPDSFSLKVFSMHCSLLGLILHHPIPSHKILPFSKFAFISSPYKKELASLIHTWIKEEKLTSDTYELHGSLVSFAYFVKQGWAEPDMTFFSPFLLKHVVTCKYAVPKPVLSLSLPLLSYLTLSELILTCEKILLRSPEVVLPFLHQYFTHAMKKTTEIFPLSVTFVKNLTNQLASSNSEIAQIASSTFSLIYPNTSEEIRTHFCSTALSLLPKCSTLSQKKLIYKTLEQVFLPLPIYSQLIKSVKTESNDNLALMVFQLLWSTSACSVEALTTSMLMETWSRVNDKIRKQVLEFVYESNRTISVDKVRMSQEPVALSLLLKYKAFQVTLDDVRLKNFFAAKVVDTYYVYAFNQLCQWPSEKAILSVSQMESCFKLIFHSSLFHLLDLNVVLTALHPFLTSLHGFLSQLPPIPSLAQCKKLKLMLSHFHSPDLVLPLFIIAHHPSLPEGLWADLAFLSKLHLENWMQTHSTECIEMIQRACFSDVVWERQAALRAAASLVWIFEKGMIGLINVAEELIGAGKSLENVLVSPNGNTPTSAKSKGKSTLENSTLPPKINSADRSSNIKKSTLSSKKETSSPSSNMPSKIGFSLTTLPADTLIGQGLSLIRSVLLYDKNIEPVIHSILSLLTSTHHADVKVTFESLFVVLDEPMKKCGPLLFALLDPNSATTLQHQDEMISSLLFQVLCLCRSDIVLTPMSFAILHVLLRKAYFLALERMFTTDKVVLNRVLDHVTFIVEIISHHSALAFSPMLPLGQLLEELFTIMKSWTKQASMIHETVVALCHARKELAITELECLQQACVSYNESVIGAALEACLYLTSPFPNTFQILVLSFTCHPAFATIAKSLVERHQFSASLADVNVFLDLCIRTPHSIACARYLHELLENTDPSKGVSKVAYDLFILIGKEYQAHLHATKVFDEFGLEVVQDIDTVTPRLGILECFMAVLPYIPSSPNVLKTWVPLLEDPSSDIQASLLRALQIYVSKHGNKDFIPILKTFSTHQNDDIRLSTSVLMSSLADLLPPEDKLRTEIMDALLLALRTPSEKVQTVVAKCLPLFSGKGQDGLLKKLSQTLFKENHYGAQRGCAYAIAEIFKAHKTLMRNFNVVDVLKKNLSTKNIAARQGALLLAECCTLVLGGKFEPYLILVTPMFLELCADTNNTIRQSTLDATHVMMAHLSSHAAILLMPVLLEGLRAEAWRTKKASVEMIATMTSGAPAQLGSALPLLVQSILEATTDPHSQVCTAAEEALKSLAHMIQVPEIMDLAPMFIEALLDANKLLKLLQLFMATKLEHYLDAPCLALLVPNLSNAITSRQLGAKSLAVQILLGLTHIVKRQQLLAYVDTLVSLLRRALEDAVDKNRAMASKALGQLVRTLGAEIFSNLIQDLFKVLNQSSSNFDKSGAAQALSEVLGALGQEELRKWMHTILKGIKGEKRDGYLVLLMFLPMTFQNDFAPFLGDTLPGVLAGLADDSSLIRETAMRAANVMIERFSTTAVDLLLTELSKCLFHSNPSVRQSSVELLGDLLAQLMGKSKEPLSSMSSSSSSGIMMVENPADYENMLEKEEEEEKQHMHSEDARATMSLSQKLKALTDTIGMDMYRETLASIYLLRFDPVLGVRHASMTVWRKFVHNTPRQLREIFPALLLLVLKYMNKDNVLPSKSVSRLLGKGQQDKVSSTVKNRAHGGAHAEMQENAELSDESGEDSEEVEDDDSVAEGSNSFNVAASTLDDVVRKLGDSIFQILLPLLTSHLSTLPKGVCLSISVLVQLCPRNLPAEMMACFSNCIIFALKHSHTLVREAGALAFNELLNHSGNACITSVLTPMLSQLPASLPGLELVITHKGHIIIPILLPSFFTSKDATLLQLLQRLFTLSSMKGSTVQVLRMLLNLYDESIVPAIRSLLSHHLSESILEGINDLLTDYSFEHLKAKCVCISALVVSAPVHLKQNWLEWFLASLQTENTEDIEALIESIDTLVKSIAKEDLDLYIGVVTTGLSKYKSNPIALQKHSRGPAPLLQVVLQSLMYGNLKEQALRALLQIIHLTPAANLKTQIIPITGPLIRILGDRVNAVVRGLALESVACLLQKAGPLLKPFLPQLSRSLLKQLELEDSYILGVAQDCFIQLLPLHPRLDTLIQDLCPFFKDASVLDSPTITIEHVVANVLMASMAQLQTPSLLTSIMVTSLSSESNLSAKLIATYVFYFPEEGWALAKQADASYLSRVCFFYLEKHVTSSTSDSLGSIPKLKDIAQLTLTGLKHSNDVVASFSALSAQFLLSKNAKIYQAMCASLESTSYMVKRCLLHSFASQAHRIESSELGPLLGALLKLVKGRSPLKSFADQCLIFALRLNVDDQFYKTICTSKVLAQEDMTYLTEYYKRFLKAFIAPPLATNEEMVLSISVS